VYAAQRTIQPSQEDQHAILYILYKKNNDDFPCASQCPSSSVAGINACSTRRLEFRIKPTEKEQKEEPVHSLA
jgi:hypothetical protein